VGGVSTKDLPRIFREVNKFAAAKSDVSSAKRGSVPGLGQPWGFPGLAWPEIGHPPFFIGKKKGKSSNSMGKSWDVLANSKHFPYDWKNEHFS